MSKKKLGFIVSGLDFVNRQHNIFKTNMLRNAIQTGLIQLTQQFQSIYTAGLGANPTQIGVVNSFGTISWALTSLPTGMFADKYGAKKIFISSLLVMSFGTLLFALAQDWKAIIPALFIFLLGNYFGRTLCPFICAKYLLSDERSLGVQLCDTVVALPVLIFPTIGATIATFFGGANVNGIRPLYYLSFVGYLSLAVVIFKVWKDQPRAVADQVKGTSFLSGYGEVFKKGIAVKKWLAFSALTSAGTITFPIFWPLFAKEVKFADPYTLGVMSTAMFILPIIVGIPMGKFADTFGKKKAIYLLSPLNILAPLLLIYATGPTTLILSMFLYGASLITIRVESSIRAELCPPELQGRFAGLIALTRAIFNLPFPIIGGMIYQHLGPQFLFFIMVAIKIMESILITTIPEIKRGEKPQGVSSSS